MPFSRAGVAEHEECHLPLSSRTREASVFPSTMPTQSRMGLGISETRRPRGFVRGNWRRWLGSEFGGGIRVSTSEPIDTYDHTTQVGQHHWIGRIQPPGMDWTHVICRPAPLRGESGDHQQVAGKMLAAMEYVLEYML